MKIFQVLLDIKSKWSLSLIFHFCGGSNAPVQVKVEPLTITISSGGRSVGALNVSGVYGSSIIELINSQIPRNSVISNSDIQQSCCHLLIH